ncbi:MAG TPA: hypothetical protein VI636_08425 [Candidatus Angelobacter sp.]
MSSAVKLRASKPVAEPQMNHVARRRPFLLHEQTAPQSSNLFSHPVPAGENYF